MTSMEEVFKHRFVLLFKLVALVLLAHHPRDRLFPKMR